MALDMENSALQPYRPNDSEYVLRQLLRLLAGSAPIEKFEELLNRPELGTLPEHVKEQLNEDMHLTLHVHRLLRQHRRRESELLALYETAQDLTALRDLDQVLQAIVRRARQLLGTDIAYLSVYDQAVDDFYVRATEGTYSEAFGQVRVPHGIGICDLVGRTGRPYFSSNYLDDERFPHSEFIDAAIQGEEVVSVLGVPLQVDTRVLGVLFVANRFARSFSQQEVSLLSSLAAHAALAIDNARMFEETEKAMEEISRANEVSEARAKEVERAATVHEQLTALVVRGRDLKDIATMVAKVLDGCVAILDEGLHVVFATEMSKGSESIILSPSAELEPYEVSDSIRSALQESKQTGRSVAFSRTGSVKCRVASMVAGSRFLGGLILWTDRTLPDIDIRTFERSAMVTATVLMSEERVMEAEYRDVSDILAGLLKGTQDVERSQREAAKRGFNLTQRMALLLIDVPNYRNSYTLRMMRKKFTRDEKNLVGELDGDLLVLMPCEEPKAAATSVHTFILDGFGEAATVAVSNLVSSPAGLPVAYRAVRRCVALLKALGKSGEVGTEAELSVYGLVFSEQRRPELEAYLHDTIGPLLKHDNSRSTMLAQTLLTFLDHGRSTLETAETLHIHVNTVRQRLEQVTQILGRWDTPTCSLELHIALRLYRLKQQILPL